MANSNATQTGTTKEKDRIREEQIKEMSAKFEKLTTEDLEALRRSVEEIRALLNSTTTQVIQLITAHSSFKLIIKDGKGKGHDQDQDARVKERAKERGVDAIQNLRMYLKKTEEELRGATETVR